MAIDAHLDAITKARSAYVLARTTLEAKLRDQLKNELNNLQTQVDIAVRYAHDAGASKASILRAMGIKDYGTVKASLDRTRGVTEIVGRDPLDGVYTFTHPINSDIPMLTVTYDSHGPNKISGTAMFEVREMDDGTIWFMSRDSLWNSDYTVRNEVVAALDGRQDGYYYEEALGRWKLLS
jgi:hypothetical protein